MPPLPTPSRRAFLRATTATGAAALGACGGSGAGPTAKATATTAVGALNGALVLEHTAVHAYTVGLPLLGPVTQPLATGFRQNHIDHRDRLIQIIRGLGGTPTPAKDSYDIGAAPADEQAMVSLAADLEDRAARTYYATLQKLDDPTVVQTLGSIMGDEAQHAAVLRSALQQDPAPASFVVAS
jgi:bacterioferritin (cytochrome b1)